MFNFDYRAKIKFEDYSQEEINDIIKFFSNNKQRINGSKSHLHSGYYRPKKQELSTRTFHNAEKDETKQRMDDILKLYGE